MPDRSPDDTRERWERRYADAPATARPPSRFLLAHLPRFRGCALDVACGAGRNAIALARHGLRVEAIDLAQQGLRMGQAIARRERLPIHFVQADLQRMPLPLRRYDVVVVIRYLHRELFAALIDALRPGGYLLVETFLTDQAALGHPKNPAFLLARGEILALTQGLAVVDHQEGEVSEDGESAFLVRYLGQRPPLTEPQRRSRD